MINKDGHIHTPFCPHGTKDSFEEYIQKALSLGLKEITFTEHAPLPDGFSDTVPTRDSAMQHKDLIDYFKEIDRVKEQFRGKIVINAGLEVDYIEGFEEETKVFLNEIGEKLDDAVLSVHFLKQEGNYDCVDYSPDLFESMTKQYGSIKALYKKYYQTVLNSINADLGPFKPKRIGHITLIRKFHKKFPQPEDFKEEVITILQSIKRNGYELDYNGAGTAKPLCREPYPSDWIVREAQKMKIPLIYGSDAHQTKDMGQGLNVMLF